MFHEKYTDTINDYYLSDIHVESKNTESKNNSELKITRIEFNLLSKSDLTNKKIEQDLDGDYLIERNSIKNLIFIEHHMQTKIEDVGLQLWRASFYMCDFLIENKHLFENKNVVELGAGLGLFSIVCSLTKF